MSTLEQVLIDMKAAKNSVADNARKENDKTVAEHAAMKLDIFIEGIKNYGNGEILKEISIATIFGDIKAIPLALGVTSNIWLRSDGKLIEAPKIIKEDADIKIVSVQYIADTYGAANSIAAIAAAIRKIKNDQAALYESNLAASKMKL